MENLFSLDTYYPTGYRYLHTSYPSSAIRQGIDQGLRQKCGYPIFQILISTTPITPPPSCPPLDAGQNTHLTQGVLHGEQRQCSFSDLKPKTCIKKQEKFYEE
jgi:hypothetical protein